MRLRSLISHLRRNQEGAAAIEFALVAVPFFLLFIGTLEFGLIMMTKVAVEGATTQVARSEAIGAVTAGCDRVCTVRAIVDQKTSGLINADDVIVTASVVSNGGASTKTPDVCLVNGDEPYPAICDGPFENNDGVTGYQQTATLTPASIGNPGNLVEIRVTYPWHVLFPVFKQYFGENGVLTITATTVVKNEQF